MPDSYLVIGGSGFLGRHIVEGLLARGDASVAVFDIVQRHFDTNVAFFSGDITVEDQLKDAIQKCQATCIFHTATPPPELDRDILWKVNVEGTKTVIAAAKACGVPKLVYTSSAGVVYSRIDIIDVDERQPIPDEKELDPYNHTKAEAEKLVLEANGQDGLATVALRPAGIFGPGDRLLLPAQAEVLKNKQTGIQIGSNENIFDWTYVANVVKAHFLAADKLTLKAEPLGPEDTGPALPSIDLTTGQHRIPTSKAKPIGPSLNPSPEELRLQEAFNDPESAPTRPTVRSRYDEFSSHSMAQDYHSNPLVVAGQAFFITNGEPVYQWDFFRAVWKAMGDTTEPKAVWKLPRSVGLVLAGLAETWARWTGKLPTFTPVRVHYLCCQRWYNIEKARRVLGYEPDVGVEEGIRRTVAWYFAEQAKAST